MEKIDAVFDCPYLSCNWPLCRNALKVVDTHPLCFNAERRAIHEVTKRVEAHPRTWSRVLLKTK